MTRRRGPAAGRWIASGLLVALGLAPLPARAADPAVKDLLGKAQTQSETKAVEDLISKLKPRAPAAAKPEEAPSGGAKSSEEKAPATGTTGAGTEASAEEAKPAKGAGAGAEPRTAKPEAPAKGAEVEQMPSVDLEVLFAYNSAVLAPEATATLVTLGRALTDARLATDSFLIAGHTDAKGGAEYNLRLSQARAEAVRRFLVDNFGIAERRLVAKGFGQKHLKDAHKPLSAVNRRVQIVNFTPPKRQ